MAAPTINGSVLVIDKSKLVSAIALRYGAEGLWCPIGAGSVVATSGGKSKHGVAALLNV